MSKTGHETLEGYVRCQSFAQKYDGIYNDETDKLISINHSDNIPTSHI